MKVSILLLTILGMIAINVVTGGLIEDPQLGVSISDDISKDDVPIEDPQQESSISGDIYAADGMIEDAQQDDSVSGDISAVDVRSRTKRASKIFFKFHWIYNIDMLLWHKNTIIIRIHYESKQAAVGKLELVTPSPIPYRACIAQCSRITFKNLD